MDDIFKIKIKTLKSNKDNSNKEKTVSTIDTLYKAEFTTKYFSKNTKNK